MNPKRTYFSPEQFQEDNPELYALQKKEWRKALLRTGAIMTIGGILVSAAILAKEGKLDEVTQVVKTKAMQLISGWSADDLTSLTRFR